MTEVSDGLVGEPKSTRDGVLSSTRKGLKEFGFVSSAACEKNRNKKRD